jgi:hypothetical protein
MKKGFWLFFVWVLRPMTYYDWCLAWIPLVHMCNSFHVPYFLITKKNLVATSIKSYNTTSPCRYYMYWSVYFAELVLYWYRRKFLISFDRSRPLQSKTIRRIRLTW